MDTALKELKRRVEMGCRSDAPGRSHGREPAWAARSGFGPEEAERLVATALARRAWRAAARSGGPWAAGSRSSVLIALRPAARIRTATRCRHRLAECCVCPVCRVIAAMRDPSPELAERLATGAGDLATGVAEPAARLRRTGPAPASRLHRAGRDAGRDPGRRTRRRIRRPGPVPRPSRRGRPGSPPGTVRARSPAARHDGPPPPGPRPDRGRGAPLPGAGPCRHAARPAPRRTASRPRQSRCTAGGRRRPGNRARPRRPAGDDGRADQAGDRWPASAAGDGAEQHSGGEQAVTLTIGVDVGGTKVARRGGRRGRRRCSPRPAATRRPRTRRRPRDTIVEVVGELAAEHPRSTRSASAPPAGSTRPAPPCCSRRTWPGATSRCATT